MPQVSEDKRREAIMTVANMGHELERLYKFRQATFVLMAHMPMPPAQSSYSSQEWAIINFWEACRQPLDYNLDVRDVRAKALQEAGLL